MIEMKTIPYQFGKHGSFEDEWNIHDKSSEWWYATGYFKDEEENLFSFQFTLIRSYTPMVTPHIIMLALTDFQTGKHFYFQDFSQDGSDVILNDTQVGFRHIALFEKIEKGMQFTAKTKDFSLDVFLDYGKGAFWHCDDGFLKMGIDEPGQTTFYYSYTNMPTKGSMILNGRNLKVEGKGWFDKQGGTYNNRDPRCMWEWFSLRFFDDEEMMLFYFPQNDYADGTYIPKEGAAKRLNQYDIRATSFVMPDGKLTYSNQWSLTVPGLKEEEYTIKPLLDGTQMNIGYYELLAGIFNSKQEQVGLCFVELLPGARNTGYESLLFAKSN